MLFERFGLGACYLIMALLMLLCLPLARSFPAGAAKAASHEAKAPPVSRAKATLGILGILTFYISLSGSGPSSAPSVASPAFRHRPAATCWPSPP
ncbi:hypothetical protein PBOI14_43250 [Pseudomonas sp. Boi14]|nr:hypothetical protein PBOI14_43250 [Pseudomonas sp. Boi14]